MKIARLFLGLLMCSMLLFSCQKPEGDVIDPWGSGDNTKFMSSSVNGIVNYARYSVTLNLNVLECDTLVLDKVELLYWESDQPSSDARTKLIVEDTALVRQETQLQYEGILEDLIPNQAYSYQLVLSDGFIMNETQDGHFSTVDPSPVVKVDTAYLIGSRFTCKASANAYMGALMDNPGYEFGIFWGLTEDSINTPVALDEVPEPDIIDEDSLCYHFSGGLANTGSASMYFRAYVKDSWGNEVYSQPYNFGRDPISSINGDPDFSQWENAGTVNLAGKALKGINDVTLYRRGFCYSLSENPSINDFVVEASSAVWGLYACTLRNLDPNTTYYYRSFLQLDDENGAVYYSADCRSFTTGDVAAPVKVTVGRQVEHSLIPQGTYVITSSVEGDISLIEESGYVWKTNASPSETITFDNSDGSIAGFNAGSAEIPSEYSVILSLMGLSLTDHDYVTVLTSLESETEYTCRAYIKLTDGSIYYSTGTLKFATPSSGK